MKIGKILVIAAFALAPAMELAAADASVYIRRGLVAQYDGIDNAGLGLHDNVAADAGLAEAGGRRARLAELAESGLDTKKSVMILFVESIPEQDKRKANNCERESHARKAVCGKSARMV